MFIKEHECLIEGLLKKLSDFIVKFLHHVNLRNLYFLSYALTTHGRWGGVARVFTPPPGQKVNVTGIPTP